MKFKEIILGTFILLILFFVLVTVFPEPIHDVLYGKYVDGSVAVTALHSGNNIIITNQGGPDLSNTMYIKVLNNNKTYPLDLEIGSNLIVP